MEECLFLFTEDLFGPHSQLEPEGYIKYIPDNPGLSFIDRLLNYDIDPALYIQSINIPELWKSYLSANGISILRSMTFYETLLDTAQPVIESLADTQNIQFDDNDKKEFIDNIK